MEIDLEHLRKPCTGGRAHEVSVKGIWVESGALRRLYDMLTEGELREFTMPIIVWDDNVCETEEEKMEDLLGICQEICLSAEDLQADFRGLEILEETIPEEADLLLAVGGGTIQELCRYVSFQRRIPYVAVPTAASGNHLLSSVALLTREGTPCPAQTQMPEYVFADTDIFAKAPYRLTAAGISALMGEYLHLADWKLAYPAQNRDVCQELWEMEYKAIREVTRHLDDIREQEEDSCQRLMYALLLASLFAEISGRDTRAYWEKLPLCFYESFYGEQIGMAALLAERKYREAGRHCKMARLEEALEDIPPAERLEEMLQEGGCRTDREQMKEEEGESLLSYFWESPLSLRQTLQ